MLEGVCLIKRLLPSFNDENGYLECKAFLASDSTFNAAYIILEHRINVEVNIAWMACHLSLQGFVFSTTLLFSATLSILR